MSLKHIVLPDVVYEYVQDMDQDKYPFFDPLDRIAGKNSVTYSVTNIFMLNSIKKRKKYNILNGRIQGSAIEESYSEISQVGRIKFSQTYNIGHDDSGKDFSPISVDIDFLPWKNFSISADMTWSMDDCFLTRNFAVSYKNRERFEMSLEHRYSDELHETFFSDALFKITDSIALSGSYESNLDTGADIESRIGAVYSAQCWSVDVGYLERDDDRRFDFKISLTGLGDL